MNLKEKAEEYLPKNANGKYSRNEVITAMVGFTQSLQKESKTDVGEVEKLLEISEELLQSGKNSFRGNWRDNNDLLRAETVIHKFKKQLQTKEEKECGCGYTHCNKCGYDKVEEKEKESGEIDNWMGWIKNRVFPIAENKAYEFWIRQALEGYAQSLSPKTVTNEEIEEMALEKYPILMVKVDDTNLQSRLGYYFGAVDMRNKLTNKE